MIGVPNRGASKAWNPLNNNWVADPAYKYVLSKFINLAWEKVRGEEVIRFNGSTKDPRAILMGRNEVNFISQYVPTIRSLLATYPFLMEGDESSLSTVNLNYLGRNSLVLDLNSGLDLELSSRDPNAFADQVGKTTVIYGLGENTATTVTQTTGGVERNTIIPFTDWSHREAGPDEVWYRDNVFDINGDGTVPLQSSRDQFVNYPKPGKIELKGFANGQNTQDTTTHTGLVSNVDVQRLVFNTLGFILPDHLISTNLEGGIVGSASNGLSFSVSFSLDPVEGFLVDGQGRRLGYSKSTGAVTEIPNSQWLGEEDGIGWIFGEIETPLKLELTGLGENYYVQVGIQQGSKTGGLEKSGFLALGEQLSIDVTWNEPEPEVPGVFLDLRDITGNVDATFTVNREAAFDNFAGFYRVTDTNGGIDIDGNGTADVTPGQSGYTEAALAARAEAVGLSTANLTETVFESTVAGGSLYAPFLIANGTPDSFNARQVFFAFGAANADGVEHIRVSDGAIRFEDLFGGGDNDFNDLVIEIASLA